MFRPKSQTSQLIGRKNVLGEKDRKVLRNQFTSQFHNQNSESFNLLFPAGEPITVLSLKGVSTEIYFYEEIPLLFVQSKRKGAQLIPTLFTLWKFPSLVPTIICQTQAPRYLIRGADLMLPGCIPPPGGYLASTDIDAGQIWAIRVLGNPLPFAVGSIIMSREELQDACKGKLLEVHHILGDLLCRAASTITYPEGFTATICVPIDEEQAANSELKAPLETEWPAKKEDVANQNKNPMPEPSSVLNKATENPTVEPTVDQGRDQDQDPDDEEDAESDNKSDDTAPDGNSGRVSCQLIENVVEYCLLEVLRKQMPDSSLPADVSVVWGKMTQILPAVLASNEELIASLKSRGMAPTESQIAELPASFDLKKTSWKSLKKMANHFKKVKVWQLKELRGTISIVKVNRAHPLMQSHLSLPESVVPVDSIRTTKGVRAPRAEKKKETDQDTSSLSAGSLMPLTGYQATAHTRELLASVGAFEGGRDPGSLFSEEEIAYLLNKIFDNLRSMSADTGEQFPSLDSPSNVEDISLMSNSDFLTRDSRLCNICLTKGERQIVKVGGPVPPVPDSQLLKRFLTNGMKVVTLLLDSGVSIEDAKLRPSDYGLIEADAKISVTTQRTKRFTRTKVAGIHMFPMIDPKQLADRLQRACAASATVCELDELKGKSKPLGVIVQGAVVREVCDVLEKQYGVPRNMLHSGV
eukprot:Gregarina_sp_Poly_1__11024@NODE_87_length_15225_cov_52_775630_g75_i0_p2_GENE_NODE_87_length_15225_cov_52_775630_g75_i0NODE_87_length_15225_cov_52_775630_g75_i0_p2_ORF_typecomplete_len696_score97_56PrePUA/PF17832_1/4_5e12SUI1/PF01253_22/1_3e04SUI1/PF01253_22/7_4e08PUA/PF01472_20/8_3e07DUF1947/PF09183_10/0_0019_NODE_87_length_15225_cov_52_775630_g75_i01126313350